MATLCCCCVLDRPSDYPSLFRKPTISVKTLFLFLAVLVAVSHAELPDISDVPADLVLPETTTGAPAPGKRVRQTLPPWSGTSVYHVLYLPNDWAPAKRYPVIVEWTGNRYKSPTGDECLGTPESAKLGYGLTGGAGSVWISLPYVNEAGTENVTTWWGEAPQYTPEPTLSYARAAVRFVCDTLGGDSSKVVLAGFSRGAIACNYLGLHDDETARLWSGFVCYSHYDGVRQWPFPSSDRQSASARLNRLKGRPQFICAEGSGADATRNYLGVIAERNTERMTFSSTGFRNHNDAWILRPSQTRARLREWFAKNFGEGDVPAP